MMVTSSNNIGQHSENSPLNSCDTTNEYLQQNELLVNIQVYSSERKLVDNMFFFYNYSSIYIFIYA